MKKKKREYLVFTENGAYIEKANDPGELKGFWLEKWDLARVEGVPARYWKYSQDGCVSAMGEAERADREAHIEKYGEDKNSRHHLSHFHSRHSARYKFLVALSYWYCFAAAALFLALAAAKVVWGRL